jgi:glutamate/tyrosine decarboxylase-like PLP-dependent enzyme
MVNKDALLDRAADHARDYLATVGQRHVGPIDGAAEVRAQLGDSWTAAGEDATAVIDALAWAAARGTVASQGPRYFGFVTGGSLPVATAADWLVAAWDQNAAVHALSPLAAALEDITVSWLRDLAGLPPTWSAGFVTGCQMANFTALAAARHAVLAREGWDVESRGLFGAPPIDVVVSEESHYTIFGALRLLGLGADRVRRVPTDGQGRMRADALAARLAETTGPCVVCAQAGNVNTGAIDPIAEIAAATAARGAWLHVDSAFGFWALATPSRAAALRPIGAAQSIATDAHKWLNVPYDSGIVLCADRAAHRRAMTVAASYILEHPTERDAREFVPEESRRARIVPVYAALRTLGRDGLADLVDRCCALARRAAERLAAHPAVTILNDVTLNQALVRVSAAGHDPDVLTRRVMALVQADGTCWAGGTVWHDMAAIRFSVSNWSTTEEDIDRSADAILRAIEAAGFANGRAMS